jgi:glycosyltransferase involved in cell wall biosynthesis
MLPVYNGAAFLESALRSILAQTWRDFECLVIDDGSTDGSGDVAERVARGDDRVRVIRRENRGLVATLNEMLSLARGRLIARMDADDISLPDRFARQVEFLAANPDVVCVGGGQVLMDERGLRIALVTPPVADQDVQESALRGHGSICHPTAMIRIDVLRALGGYRAAHYPAEDLDLWLRLGEAGRLANLGEPVLFYRIHSGSISGAAASGGQREAARRACVEAWARRQRTDIVFEAGTAWRPSNDADSRYKFALEYGWRAYQSGFGATALAYAWRSVKIKPLKPDGWRIMGLQLLRPKPRNRYG